MSSEALEGDQSSSSFSFFFLSPSLVTFLFEALAQLLAVGSSSPETHARIVTLVANVESPRTLDPIAYESMVSEAVEAFLDHAREEERVRLPQLELFITQEENTVSSSHLTTRRATELTY